MAGQPSAMTVIPRWEWRAFSASFGTAESRFESLSPERVEKSDEVYVLSLASDASVKLRGGLMDVKHRLSTNDDGLEQWIPAMKASFPLSPADARFVLETLGAADPSLDRPADTIDDLTRGREDLLVVAVHKRRERYTIGGCMAERTEIRTDKGATRTIAVEAEDPDRVRAVVLELGLGSRRVVCVARGLKALVGFGARRYAVIDVGTNSVKFHVGERGADGEWRKVVDRAEVTRLGEGLDEAGRLGAPSIERTVEAIAAMAAEANEDGVEAIVAVGTAGLRIAPNAAELVDAVLARSGVRVEIISGEEEARLAYLGATAGLPLAHGSLAVFDTGGGSSQFTFGDTERVDERFSLNVGAARFTERYGLDGVVSEDTLAAALAAIAGELERLDGRPAPDAVVAMGGAVTNLAAVKHGLSTYDPDVVQGTVLDRGEIDRQIELYRTRTTEQRHAIVGLQPNRGEVILAGACIVRTVLATLGAESLTVSDRGLRHGLLAERFSAQPTVLGSAGAG
jgi:exopolyphosphatase/guanosine-5'-triphosphate,3'-diphosphate pyrophosphatase